MRDPVKAHLSRVRYEQSAHGRAMRRRYVLTSERSRERDRLRQRRKRKKPEAKAAYARWHRQPGAKRAVRKVQEAIKSGRLVRKPCEVCGNPRSQGHHDDYSKPLEVRWLCAVHHRRYHLGIEI